MEKTSKTISNAPTFMYKENVKDVQYASTVQRHRYLLWVARVHVGLQTAADRAPHPHQRAISSPHCPHCPEALKLASTAFQWAQRKAAFVRSIFETQCHCHTINPTAPNSSISLSILSPFTARPGQQSGRSPLFTASISPFCSDQKPKPTRPSWRSRIGLPFSFEELGAVTMGATKIDDTGPVQAMAIDWHK